MNHNRPHEIYIIGPTACGKTSRAVSLARAIDGEIVSADSRQIYRGMDIGTGKDLDEYGDIPYHLIDIVAAGEKYNLFRFLHDARAAVDDINRRGHTAVICGGTGMYVEALLRGTILPEVPRNETLRASLAGKSLHDLTLILASMKQLHNSTDTDTVARAVRAIEIQSYYTEHPELSPHISPEPRQPQPHVFVIDIPREERRRRISSRLETRLEAGMIDEVQRLIDSGIPTDTLIAYGLEYRYVTEYLTGKYDFATMHRLLETAIHQFAKRQLTWIRGMERRGCTLDYVPYDMDAETFNNLVIGICAES